MGVCVCVSVYVMLTKPPGVQASIIIFLPQARINWEVFGWKGIRHKDGGGGGTDSLDGVVSGPVVSVPASVIFPCTIKSRRLQVKMEEVDKWCSEFCITVATANRGPIYKISYDLSQDYRKFIVRSTYDSDLHATSSLGNIVSSFTNTVSDDLTILQVNCIREKPCILHKMFCKLDIYRKLIVTLALS